jgi:hypothetical protein
MIKKYRGETIRINVISAMKYEIENIIEEVTWNLTFAKRRTDKVFKNESVRSKFFFCVDDKMTTHNLHCAESEQIHYFGKARNDVKGFGHWAILYYWSTVADKGHSRTKSEITPQ